MSRRERMEAKLEKRREWAESRAKKSDAAFNRAHTISDGIPLGQPILVGHHSERHHRRDIARIDSAMRQGVESSKMAEHHASKADGIESQLDSSIFSDDANAIEALERRITERESEAALTVALSKVWRTARKKGGLDAAYRAVADAGMKPEAVVSLARSISLCPWLERSPFSATLTRQSIRKDRERIEWIRRQNAARAEAEAAPGGVVITGEGADHGFGNIRFAEKPERATLDALRGAGWSYSGGCWGGYFARLPEGFVASLREVQS